MSSVAGQLRRSLTEISGTIGDVIIIVIIIAVIAFVVKLAGGISSLVGSLTGGTLGGGTTGGGTTTAGGTTQGGTMPQSGIVYGVGIGTTNPVTGLYQGTPHGFTFQPASVASQVQQAIAPTYTPQSTVYFGNPVSSIMSSNPIVTAYQNPYVPVISPIYKTAPFPSYSAPPAVVFAPTGNPPPQGPTPGILKYFQ
jgi:hypothetical protein